MTRAWHALRARVASWLFRGRREADLREELQLHLERETDRLEASGLSRAEAQLEARRLFGAVEPVKEACRDARGTAALDALVRDTRHGFRRLARDWAFTAGAVVILGLAIGANTVVFSAVNAVLFRDASVLEPHRLVNIYQNDPAGRPLVVTSYDTYQRIAEYTDIFAGTMAATIPTPVRYLHDGVIRNAVVESATSSYLEVLGLQPALGRWFEEGRPGDPLVAVLGHRAWTAVFGADPAVIGRIIRIEGRPVTIVGVGPASHRGIVDVGVGTDFWMPVTALPATQPPEGIGGPTIFAPLLVNARLRDGVTVAQARAAMDLLARRLADENPEMFRRSGEFALSAGITVVPSEDVRVHPQADVALMTLAALVVVVIGLVLAIACSNLATLLLVRGATRAKEISVRLAMGARRSQIVRHLVIESVLLSLAGGLAGCVLAWWGLGALQGIDLPVRVELGLDYRVLAFAVALSLVTGIAFGLAPALETTKVDLLATLREDGLQPIDHRRLTLKNALIVVQVAISVLLLGGTSIFLQWAEAAGAHPVGYAVDGVAILQTDTTFTGYSDERARAVFGDLLRHVQGIPGVQSAALLRGMPMGPTSVSIALDAVAGESGPDIQAVMMSAGPGFFDTLRIPILFGRVFDARDRADTPRVAVITDRLAQQYFRTPNAVGRRFQLADVPDSWMEVIGVVRDTGTGSLINDVLDPIAPPFYVSYEQAGALPTTVIARASGDATALVAAMQRELRAIDVTLPVVAARTMKEHLELGEAGPRAIGTFLAALGGLGLLLASIGLYAVVSFAVARRTREIGIRMALGARSQQVVWSIARGMAALIAVGTAAGLVLSILAMLALRTSSGDIGIGNIAVYHARVEPMALLAIAAVTALVGVAAAFVPGRRAARMDPLVALRHE